MERAWIRAGHDPHGFWGASLRQVFAVLRAARDRERSDWERTIHIVAKIHNVNARKKKDLVDPVKMIEQMFGVVETPKAKQVSLMDKFRMLALQTGGKDYRKSKPS